MKSLIISIGDELLTGDISNTNAAYMAKELHKFNVDVVKIVTIGDDYAEIYNALEDLPESVTKVFVTGGLGPTHDDITKKVAVDFFDSEMIFHADLFADLKKRFAKLNIPMSDANRSQALLPKNCQIIKNPRGTAPGMKFTKAGVDFYFMPGVPHEMKYLLSQQIIPAIKGIKNREFITKTLRTYGVGESSVYDQMKSWIEANPEIRVAYYPRYTGVDIKLHYAKKFRQKVDQIITMLGKFIYGFNSDKIEEKIAGQLIDKKLTIAVAESCTGGLITSRLTDVPGSSAYMMLGAVTYANQAKIQILGVKEETIRQYGAVSKEVALDMAAGVRRIHQTDIGISTTGIAGPGGGTEDKPVGTLWGAISMGEKTEAFHYCRNINREANKLLFSQFIFKKLLENLY
ncbi:MAG: competence/damage-inducible protein A [Fidelibacterota bacterium]